MRYYLFFIIFIVFSCVNKEELELISKKWDNNELTDLNDVVKYKKSYDKEWLYKEKKFIFAGQKKIISLEGIENLPADMKIIQVSGSGIQKISHLDKFTQLKELNLGGNPIEKIEGLDNLVNLEILWLSGCKITKIEGLDNLKNLRTLYLGYNQINKIEGLENLKSLTSIDLKYNNIKVIENLEGCTSLYTIDLSVNPIEVFENIHNVKTLKSVWVWEGTQFRSDPNPWKYVRKIDYEFAKNNFHEEGREHIVNEFEPLIKSGKVKIIK